MREDLPKLPCRLHLAVTGSVGGTTLALQYARQSIVEGGRVIWASEKIPDPVRFSQIFADVDIVSSSRFHAIELGTNLEQGIKQVIDASDFLPSVILVVIDDWAPKQGKTPSSTIALAEKVLAVADREMSVILTSKTYGNPAAGADSKVRGGERLENAGCETWHLTREESKPEIRQINSAEESFSLRLGDEGYY